MSPRAKRVLGSLLLLPLLYTAGFWIYVSVASDPGCGSQAPGLCFGWGITQLFSIPLAMIGTPIALALFAMARRQSRDSPR